MQLIDDVGAFFEGAVSVEQGDGWFRPWRLPHEKHLLFPCQDDNLFTRAGTPSGVRLRFKTDSQSVKLCVVPLDDYGAIPADNIVDMTVENAIVASAKVLPGTDEILFSGLPAGEKIAEIWLPAGVRVMVRNLQVDDGATCVAAPDARKRWVTYGSSLTHCIRANSSARIWPAIVARRCNLHLTALGFGGQCHMDPMLALVIRDLPVDYISLKMGINIMGHGSLNIRTFAANMIGMIQIIREKHPQTPIALVSPFASTPFESTPNSAAMTLEIMREQTRDVFNRLIEYGDKHLVLCDGTKIVDEASLQKYAQGDFVHHDGDGIEEIGDRWMEEVMGRFGLPEAAVV